MSQWIAGLLALLQLICPVLTRDMLTERLLSGQWLRLHVVAHDDSEAMQRLKLQVRDAVQSCYAARQSGAPDMLQAAGILLPDLTHAAEAAARSAGFTGEVDVALGVFPFGERKLDALTIPAGEYPALIIRLGDAQGQNWWGLLDPETSLAFAAIGETPDGQLFWDWSWRALLTALFGLPIAGDA